MTLALSKESPVYLSDDSIYDTATCFPAIETTIIDYIIPAGATRSLSSVVVGGNDRARFYVKIDGSVEVQIRNAWNDRTKEIVLGNRQVFPGEHIEVTVTNDGTGFTLFEARVNMKIL